MEKEKRTSRSIHGIGLDISPELNVSLLTLRVPELVSRTHFHSRVNLVFHSYFLSNISPTYPMKRTRDLSWKFKSCIKRIINMNAGGVAKFRNFPRCLFYIYENCS